MALTLGRITPVAFMCALLQYGHSIMDASQTQDLKPANMILRLSDGSTDDISDLFTIFGGLDRATAEQMFPAGSGSFALSETMELLSSLDVLPTTDTGDVACQGHENTRRLIALGRGNQSVELSRTWLQTLPIDADGRPWDSLGQQYHQKSQGAWEAGAEFVLMAQLHAAHTGDTSAFRSTPDRLVCVNTATSAPHSDGAGRVNHWQYVGALAKDVNASQLNTLCTSRLGDVAAAIPAYHLYNEAVNDRFVIYNPSASHPQAPQAQVVAAAKRLLQRVTLTQPFSSFLLPLQPPRGTTPYPLQLCVRDMHSGDVIQ
eukprot:m.1430121 g.1430121  ORF g.1430121 m.1430121 type:complete len:316 (-) comp25071_c0_seq5:5910-6857(-)